MSEDEDELEEGLKQRDGRFVWRLAMLLAISILAALWLAGWLTRTEIGDCAARGFQNMTTPGAPNSHPEAHGP